MVLSRLFRPQTSIILSLDEAASVLKTQLFSVEKMEARSMGGNTMQRIKVKKGDTSFILTSDGRILTFLVAVKLGDGWGDMDILKWNANKSYMTFTYSPEGNMAILKHHCFISNGVPEKTFLRLAEIWIGFIPRFLQEMELSKLDLV